MPALPIMLSATSFTRMRKQGAVLLPPHLPIHLTEKGADCGGFQVVMRWGGSSPFSLRQYVTWLARWHPQWAITPDLCCLDPSTRGDPGAEEVRRRQAFATAQAQDCWLVYHEVPWCWCPVIQGYHLADFERHARALAPLIREMWTHYWDTGSGDEEQEQRPSAFRVAIGSLCRRLPRALVYTILLRVMDIIGSDVPIHLLGTKLHFLQFPGELPAHLSLDTGAWNELFGKEHEARRASGLSVRDYSWQVCQPRYADKIATALSAPKQMPLFAPPF